MSKNSTSHFMEMFTIHSENVENSMHNIEQIIEAWFSFSLIYEVSPRSSRTEKIIIIVRRINTLENLDY